MTPGSAARISPGPGRFSTGQPKVALAEGLVNTIEYFRQKLK